MSGGFFFTDACKLRRFCASLESQSMVKFSCFIFTSMYFLCSEGGGEREMVDVGGVPTGMGGVVRSMVSSVDMSHFTQNF